MSWGSLTLGYGLKGFLDNSSHHQLSPGALACWSNFSCIFLNFKTVLICCIKSQVFNWGNSHVDLGRKSLVFFIFEYFQVFWLTIFFWGNDCKILFYIENPISWITHCRLSTRRWNWSVDFDFHTKTYVFGNCFDIFKSDTMYQSVAKKVQQV